MDPQQVYAFYAQLTDWFAGQQPLLYLALLFLVGFVWPKVLDNRRNRK